MQKRFSRALKINWIIFILLSLLVVFGNLGLQRFYNSTKMTLTKGETAEFTVTRLHDTNLAMEISHPKMDMEHDDFGEVVYANGKIKKMNIPYPVKFKVSNGKNEKIYQALGVDAWGADDFLRSLYPISNHEGTMKYDEELSLYAKTTNVKITIIEVAPKLEGQTADVWIKPPVSFKVMPSGQYKFWWWFTLSFYYVLILAVYLLILLLWSGYLLFKNKKS